MQIPRVNYTKKYSPIATVTTIKHVIVICLLYGWKLKRIYIEAAVLEGDIKEHMYNE